MKSDTQSEIRETVGHFYRWAADGPDGEGWYAWSTEYPEDGYMWFRSEKELIEGCTIAMEAP